MSAVGRFARVANMVRRSARSESRVSSAAEPELALFATPSAVSQVSVSVSVSVSLPDSAAQSSSLAPVGAVATAINSSIPPPASIPRVTPVGAGAAAVRSLAPAPPPGSSAAQSSSQAPVGAETRSIAAARIAASAASGCKLAPPLCMVFQAWKTHFYKQPMDFCVLSSRWRDRRGRYTRPPSPAVVLAPTP